MHLDDEQVQRLLHGEFGTVTAASLREHLAVCVACERRVADAAEEERRTRELLGHLDHAPPRVTVETIVHRAGAGRFAWGRWAAGFLLALGAAGALYATPGSPLRGWIATALERFRHVPDVTSTPPPPAADPSGIVVGAGRDLVIEFESTPAPGHVRVALTDGVDVEVRTLQRGATFTSDEESLLIRTADTAATFDIRLPRAAPRIEIRIGRARVFLKEGARITTEATADATGTYLLPR